MNPRSTDCEADTLTSPSHRLPYNQIAEIMNLKHVFISHVILEPQAKHFVLYGGEDVQRLKALFGDQAF